MREQVIPTPKTSRLAFKPMLQLDEGTLRGLMLYHSLSNSDCTIDHEFRWYVKGYWRTYCRGTRHEHYTWVKPHLRGPKGAPIKGV